MDDQQSVGEFKCYTVEIHPDGSDQTVEAMDPEGEDIGSLLPHSLPERIGDEEAFESVR